MPRRLEAVLEAVYGAYAMHWQEDSGSPDMSGEALFLARLLVELLPGEPEALGLLALLAFSHARRAARTLHGVMVPLEQQDTSTWDQDLVQQAHGWLKNASAFGRLGRFQLEAAIQSVHACRADGGQTDWLGILHLYDGLCALWPTVGAQLGRITALGEVAGADAALTALRAMDPSDLKGFQPALASQAHWLARMGRVSEACEAYDQAIALTPQAPLRRWLLEQRSALV
jgi:RNA polymerase sigma-70 factor (ECF subfamily)